MWIGRECGKVIQNSVQALYGGKCSGLDFRNHLRSCMTHIGFAIQTYRWERQLKWMVRALKINIGLRGWCILVILDAAQSEIRNEIGKHFEFKEVPIGECDMYLRGKVSKTEINNGAKEYTFSLSHYVKSAAAFVETYSKEKNFISMCWNYHVLYCPSRLLGQDYTNHVCRLNL